MNFEYTIKNGPFNYDRGVILYTFLKIESDHEGEFGLLYFVPGTKIKLREFIEIPKHIARKLINEPIIDEFGNYYYFGEKVLSENLQQLKVIIGSKITYAQKEIKEKTTQHIATESEPSPDSRINRYSDKYRKLHSKKKSRKKSRKKSCKKSCKKSRKKSCKKSRSKRIRESIKKKYLFYLKKFQE